MTNKVPAQTTGADANASDDVAVSHSVEASRYEIHVGETLAGFAEYRVEGDVISFTHTEIDPQFEGKGLGSILAKVALDDVRVTEPRRLVRPECSFIENWISRHPDYAELLER